MNNKNNLPIVYPCFALLVLSALVGCDAFSNKKKFSGDIFGTTYNVTTVTEKSLSSARIQAAIDGELEGIDKRMSNWRTDSEISKFNASEPRQWFSVSADVVRLVELGNEWSRWSGGAYDLTAAPLVDLWGFGPKASAGMPKAPALAEAMSMVDYSNLMARRNPPALYKNKQLKVDLSSLAKGYAVDRVAAALVAMGITDYLVEIGGEVRVGGQKAAGKPWRVGIERPERGGGGGTMATVELDEGALASSGDYRNFMLEDGRFYSHMIDARTGKPVQSRLAGVTVYDQQAVNADGMVTMLQVLGEDAGFRLAESRGIAALFVLRDKNGYIERATSHFTMTIDR